MRIPSPCDVAILQPESRVALAYVGVCGGPGTPMCVCVCVLSVLFFPTTYSPNSHGSSGGSHNFCLNPAPNRHSPAKLHSTLPSQFGCPFSFPPDPPEKRRQREYEGSQARYIQERRKWYNLGRAGPALPFLLRACNRDHLPALVSLKEARTASVVLSSPNKPAFPPAHLSDHLPHPPSGSRSAALGHQVVAGLSLVAVATAALAQLGSVDFFVEIRSDRSPAQLAEHLSPFVNFPRTVQFVSEPLKLMTHAGLPSACDLGNYLGKSCSPRLMAAPKKQKEWKARSCHRP